MLITTERPAARRLLLIVNPNAGKRSARASFFSLCDGFTKGGYEVTAYPTQCAGDAARVAREKGGDFDLIVCSGGDGTFSEVIGGLSEQQDAPPVAYIPAGTMNDYAFSLGLPSQPKQAVASILSGTPRKIDMGRFNGRPFSYSAAFGLMSEVSYTTSQEAKNTLGRLAYFFEGLRHFSEMRVYHVRIDADGTVYEDDYAFCLVSNSLSVGSVLKYDPASVEFDDGLFEVMLVRDPGSQAVLTRVMLGALNQLYDEEYILRFRAAKLELVCGEEMEWTLDGEYGGACSAVSIHNIKQAYTLLSTPADLSSKAE